jgi:hypothetical protein
MPTPTIPPARPVLREALLAQSALTATALGVDIRFSKPSTWPPKPILVLTTVDEVELRPECNRCRVQADLYAAGTDVASAEAIESIAAVLQSVARDCDGNWVNGDIRNCQAPTRLPSPDVSGRGRIIVDFTLEVTP